MLAADRVTEVHPSTREKPASHASRFSLAPVLLLALLVLLFFLPAFSLRPDGLRFGADIVQNQYPLKFFLKQSLLAGEFPLYDPYMFSGMPFVQQASLYPPDLLLFLILPLKVGIWTTQIAHLLLAAIGMYLLVRHYTGNWAAATLAAVSFAFSSSLSARIFAGHLLLLEGGAWLPWILLCYERSLERGRAGLWAIAAGALLALSVVAGSLEMGFMNGLALGLRFVWELAPVLRARNPAGARALILRFAALLAIVLGLTAVAVLPLLELIGLSERAGQGLDITRQRSLPWMNLATFVIPDLLGNAALRNTIQGSLSVESAAYVGLAPLLVAAFAMLARPDRRVWFYVALGALAVFVALGANNPLARTLPGFSKLPAPYRFVFLWSFAVPVLAGLGAHLLSENALDPRRLRRFLGLVLGIAALAAAITALYFVFREPILAVAKRQILARYPDDAALRLGKLGGFYATQLRALALWTLLCALTGLLLIARSRAGAAGPRILSCGLIALAVFDLGAQNLKYMANMGPMETERTLGYEAFLARDREPYRVLTLASAGIPPNAPVLRGIASVTGYESVISKSYKRYLDVMEGSNKIDMRAPLLQNHRSPLVDRLNVKYVLSGKPISDDALVPVHASPTVRVYRKTTYSPRARIVHRIETVSDEEAVLKRLAGMPAAAPVALIAGGAAPPAIRALPAAEREPAPEVSLDGPNRRIARVALAEPGLLVFSEVFFPGWKAIVDGRREVPIVRTDYLFCGVPVPEGRHIVELVYSPASLRIGAAISGATLALVLLLGLTAARRRG